jgi:adenosine deaminase
VLDIKEIQQLHIDTFGLPKIELHAHIGGCFRPSTFLELAEKVGADLDKVDFYKVDINSAFEFFKIGA